MHKLAAPSTLVLSAFLVTACDRSTPTVVEPTTVNAAGVSADVRVAAAVVDPVGDRSCRALTIPLDLIVRAGDLAVSLTGVRMRFEGTSDVPTPQTLPPAPLSPRTDSDEPCTGSDDAVRVGVDGRAIGSNVPAQSADRVHHESGRHGDRDR